MRWILLDEITEIQKGTCSRAKSRVPHEAYTTEALFIEMMAQTGAVLLGAENDFKDDVVFAKIEASSFPLEAIPDESIEIMAASDNLRPEGSWFEAEIRNSRGTLATARFMLVNAGKLVPGKQSSTTFHENFMKHYKVREKIR